MKKLIIGLFLLLPLQIVNGQDKIITIQQDTISQIRDEQKEGNRDVVGKSIPWVFLLILIINVYGVFIIKKKSEKAKKELEHAQMNMNLYYSIVVHDIYNRIVFLRQLSSLSKTNVSEINKLAQNTENLLEKLRKWADRNFKDAKLLCDKKSINLREYKNKFNIPIDNQNKLSYDFSKVNFIYADEIMIEIILENLITNAMKYTHSGEIKVYSKNDEEYVRIFVEDTGSGISQDRLKNIFSVFSDEKGLGLHISRRLTEAQGGELTVQSTVGKGTVFCVSLPIPVNEMQIPLIPPQ